MGQKTIRQRLIIAGIVAVLIPLFITGAVIYVQLSGSLLETAREKSAHMARDTSDLIGAILMQEVRIVSAIAADPDILGAVKKDDFQVAQEHLEAIHKRIGRDLFTIFITDKRGTARADAIFKQQIGLSLSDREYFLRGKKGQTSVTGPLPARGTATPGDTIIVVSAPIRENKEFYGIVAMAFSADFLTELLGRKNMGRTGYAFLINSQGLVLVHPKKELNLKFNLLMQPGTEAIGEAIKDGKTGTVFYSFEGVAKVAGLAKVESTGWITAFTQNKSEIMAPVNQTLMAILISGIAFLLTTILIIIYVYSRISSPIQRMMDVTKQVTRHSTEIMLQLGLDRKVKSVNSAFEKITGRKNKEMIGTGLEYQQFHNVSQEELWEALERGETWSGRVQIKDAYGNPAVLDVMILPLKTERDEIQGYLELGRDVTTEVMYEKRLNQAHKLEAIGTLAGGIAHDFNNILGGIMGYAELSLMKKDSAEDTARYIEEIISASERARDLISRILTFSRKTEVDLRPISVRLVLEEALKLLRASIPATIEIQTVISSDSNVMGEATQLHQVVMNLFTNAVHAMGSKPGTINVELEDFEVDEEFIKSHPNIKKGKHVLLRISDSGKGIDPEVIDNIFNPFFTTKAQGEGTGLGLSVVHGIVNNMGGIITVYSEPGKGTVFNVFMPAEDAEAEPSAWTPGPPAEAGTERIALVDDETSIASTMESILTSLGYRVHSFSDGREALETIKGNPAEFDLVITDFSMPRVTGLDLARNLREAKVHIPIILTSGYLDKEVEDEARTVGVKEFMIKPVSIAQLTETIRRALG